MKFLAFILLALTPVDSQGAAPKKSRTTPWWVGQKPKKQQGQIRFPEIFVWRFRTPLTEKRPKTPAKTKKIDIAFLQKENRHRILTK
jgi:hypothetical protein